jgi:hypothetical protein
MFAALMSFTYIHRFVFFCSQSLLFFRCLFFYTAHTKYTRKYDMDDQRTAATYRLSWDLRYFTFVTSASVSTIFDRTFDMCFFSFIRSICGLEQSARRKNICANWRERWSARENSMNTFPSSNAHAIFAVCLAGAECLPVCERSLQNARCWCRNATTQIYRNLVRSYIKL